MSGMALHPATNSFPIAINRGFKITDYISWVLMLFVNVPVILELIGIDTILKPYRVLSLVLSVLALPAFLRQPAVTSQFARPLVFAILYVCSVTIVFAGRDFVGQAPLLVTCIVLFLATYGITSKRSLNVALIAYVISFLVSSYFGLIAFSSGKYRLSGLFDNPNAFGYCGCFAFLILINRYVKLPRYLKYSLAFLLVPVLILTGSRGTILALLGVVVSQTWRNPKLFTFLVFSGVMAGLVIQFFGDQIAEQFADRAVLSRYQRSIVERGASGRLAQIRAGLQVSAEHGFIGIGLGQYREKHHTRFFQQKGLDGQISKLELHNVFVSLLCEWGIVGFGAFTIITFRLVQVVKFYPHEGDFIYGFLGASLLNGLGNNLLAEIPFWLMLGVVVQMIRFAHEERQIAYWHRQRQAARF